MGAMSKGSLQPLLREIHLGEYLKQVLNVCGYGVNNGSSHIQQSPKQSESQISTKSDRTKRLNHNDVRTNIKMTTWDAKW
jgi:hypothetical protein